MVDNEVAEILAEIKQRVISQHGPSVAGTSGNVESSPGAFTKSTPAATNVYANLPVMARTWDRLPPLVSNRTGGLAKLELWVKSALKRATRWFTWEQVNFNSAAYQTFVELVETLTAWEQQLAATKQRLDTQGEELSSLTNQLEQMDRQHLAIIAQLSARVEGLSQMAKDRHVEQQARLAEFVAEAHLGDENVLDEQRVCYKQLALELGEFRVIAGRARRELEGRVAKLETDAG